MPKKENYKELPDDELKKKLNELVEGLFKLRFRKVTDVVENPAQFKKDRRNIARIKTVLHERELKAKAERELKAKAERELKAKQERESKAKAQAKAEKK